MSEPKVKRTMYQCGGMHRACVGKNDRRSLRHESGGSVPSTSAAGSRYVERSMKRESRRGMIINRHIAWEWNKAR